ncbi:hypothetical protein Neosp_012115 [[Neocosmospora] mangrovei]
MTEPATEEYTIGWICALQEEFDAACRMLDDEFDGPDAADSNDDNTYVFGRIHKHNVVIGCLPSGIYGTTPAACVARDMVRTFPNLKFALMVGIGGGAPTPERDIRLGDVVVSEPKGELGGVLQYDLGKRLPGGKFHRTGQLNAPPRVLLGAFPEVRRRHNDPRKRHSMTDNVSRMDDIPEYSRPASDELYRADSRHHSGKTCDECDSSGLVERSPRPPCKEIMIHYGTIASGNTVMKDAAERDRYANDPSLNVLCFEMEAAGLMNDFPCLVVRGICDYSDDHKNDKWHNYAALTAAAYARGLLEVVKPQRVASQPAWAVLGEVQEGVREVLHHQRSEEEEKLWQWVSPIDHFKTQIDKSRSRNPETRAGQWLLDSPEFKEFLGERNMSLFCPGIPGAGKTVLTSVVVDYLLKLQRAPNGNDPGKIGVAFIYLDFKQQLELVSLLGSILRQLAADHPSTLNSIRRLHEEYKKESRPLSLSETRDILHSIAPSFSRLFIVVDALDEGEKHVSDGILTEIFNLQRTCGANIFATSRHIPDIERKFERAQHLEIRAADEDVRSYVDSYMEKLPRFVTQSLELQEETRTGIVKAIDGMFLLATLHLDSLIGARSVRAFRDALGRLPTGTSAYDHAYDLALDRIEGQVQNRRDLAIEALSWVVCARRHLKTNELQHALAVIAGSTHFDESNIPDMDDVISVCAGLVAVDPGRDIVRLVHYTAQEYLDREREKRLPNAQSHLTTTCLSYLSFDCFQDDFSLSYAASRGDDDHPFYRYAAQNWGYHARETLVSLPAVLDFLKCKKKLETQARLLPGGTRFYSLPYNEAKTGITGLHVAAYFGILEAVRLLEDETYIDLTDNSGWTPLSWASFNGQAGVVAYLLDTGKVRPNLADSLSRTPLHLAAMRGHRTVMELLLTRGHVDVNTRGEHSYMPLHITVLRRDVATTEVLLDHGADLNQSSQISQKPAQLAIANDDVAIIRLLLEKREIELDKALLLANAASKGSLAVTRFLVDKCDVDVNSKYSHGETALLLALRRGHTEVTEFLLANDQVDCILKDSSGKSPLHLAASRGNTAALKLLLAKDEVDPNSRDNAGRSALSYAVTNRQLEILQILVKAKNSNINSTNERGQTPLLELASALGLLAVSVHLTKATFSKRERYCSGCADWAVSLSHPDFL